MPYSVYNAFDCLHALPLSRNRIHCTIPWKPNRPKGITTAQKYKAKISYIWNYSSRAKRIFFTVSKTFIQAEQILP